MEEVETQFRASTTRTTRFQDQDRFNNCCGEVYGQAMPPNHFYPNAGKTASNREQAWRQDRTADGPDRRPDRLRAAQARGRVEQDGQSVKSSSWAVYVAGIRVRRAQARAWLGRGLVLEPFASEQESKAVQTGPNSRASRGPKVIE